MGLFFVFFPDHEFPNKNKPYLSLSFSLPSLNVLNSPPTSSTAARSAISICLLLIFITFLLFIFCTFDPSSPLISPPHHQFLRHHLSDNIHYRFALQGMGNLYRRGTTSMNDLAICHVSENATKTELRLFLRLLHRSGIASRSDVVLVFDSINSDINSVVREEDESFLRLVGRRPIASGFNRTSNLKEPLWGKENEKKKSFGSLTRSVYGSMVGFETAELDPENALSGFMDSPVPMGLRRWACYPMLLGRVRRSFKRVILLDARKTAVIRDPLRFIHVRNPESVYLMTMGITVFDGRRITTAVLFGGAKGIRRMAMFLTVEIVRSAIRHKGRRNGVVSEESLLNEVARNGVLGKNVDLVTVEEGIEEMNPRSWSSSSMRGNVMLRSRRNRGFENVVLKEMCSYEGGFEVYENCSPCRKKG